MQSARHNALTAQRRVATDQEEPVRPPKLVYVPLVAAALLAAGGCAAMDPPNAQQGGICVDEVTQERIDDERCGDYDDEGRSSAGGGVLYVDQHQFRA